MIWNKTRQSDACKDRPEAEWVSAAVPHLCIVSDEAWAAAHRRIENAAVVYPRRNNGQVWGRPPSDIASKYLLSGLLRCACCGASMTVRSSHHGRCRFFYFICASYDHRGRTVCANGLPLPMIEADEAILGKLSGYVLDPTIVEGAIADAVQELRPSRDMLETKRQALPAELRRLDDQQARYVAAIAAAGQIEALVVAMQTCERDRQRVQHDLATLDSLEQFTTFDVR